MADGRWHGFIMQLTRPLLPRPTTHLSPPKWRSHIRYRTYRSRPSPIPRRCSSLPSSASFPRPRLPVGCLRSFGMKVLFTSCEWRGVQRMACGWATLLEEWMGSRLDWFRFRFRFRFHFRFRFRFRSAILGSTCLYPYVASHHFHKLIDDILAL